MSTDVINIPSMIDLTANIKNALKPSNPASETGSLFSSNIRERLKDFGNPLRGPILFQIAIHYVFFVFVLTSANQLGWAPYIRVFMGVIYIVFALLILQISRLCLLKSPNSVIPLYLSLIPFAILIIISREVHMITLVLWFVSLLVIYLQSGHNDLQKHLLIFFVVLLAVYCVSVYFMSVFYTDSCIESGCGIPLTVPIDKFKEMVIIVGCFGVIGVFIVLERFVKRNAIILLERENYMNQLYLANIDLKRQLKKANNNAEIDLVAPLQQAIQILIEIKDTPDLEPEIVAQINSVIQVLGSDQLYKPDLYQKSADADVHDWLKDMLLTSGNTEDIHGMKRILSKVESDRSFENVSAENYVEVTKNITTIPKTIEITLFDQNIFDTLGNIDNPNFNIFELDDLTGGKPLLYIGWYIFRLHDFFLEFGISEAKFKHWCMKIESGYKPTNPYHNSVHAADVTHGMHYYISRSRLWNHLLPEERLSSIIAAIIHDYMHPGVNNAFLIATYSPLSIRYNDSSVLENFHTSAAFELMEEDEFNILSTLSTEVRKHVREMIISMVMATDIASHFEWIGKFKNKISAGQGFNFENKADRKLVLNIAIKCADVNNPAKPINQYKKWTENIMEEFFRQGDEEKSLGVPISMFMNRETTDIPKCQIGFIDFIVFPLFETWYNFMQEDVQTNMDNLQFNKSYWKAKAEKNSTLNTKKSVTDIL
ncbi:High affinity cAMP-specific 3',5'-cyclic phosphodiesterase 7A, partial [Nowakowskiella sp. JEL0078]